MNGTHNDTQRYLKIQTTLITTLQSHRVSISKQNDRIRTQKASDSEAPLTSNCVTVPLTAEVFKLLEKHQQSFVTLKL